MHFSNLAAVFKALERNKTLLEHIQVHNPPKFLTERISSIRASVESHIDALKLIESIQGCWSQTDDLIGRTLEAEVDCEFELCKETFVKAFQEEAESSIRLESLHTMQLEATARIFSKKLQQVMKAIRDLRELYPVLSFVSDAELLDLAKSFTHPETLNRYLPKLILGINTVDVDDGMIVTVRGCNNDIIPLVNPVYIDQYAHIGELILQLRLDIQKSLANCAKFPDSCSETPIQLARLHTEADSGFAVKVGPFDLPYEFNYVPITDYVETERSRRFFVTAVAAMKQGLGVCLFGPAGTGKTETVKALGVKIGVPVYVYCCDETFEYRSFERIMTGIESIGGWLCLDEFNRLDQGTMSSVSDLIHAKMTGKSTGIRKHHLVASWLVTHFPSHRHLHDDQSVIHGKEKSSCKCCRSVSAIFL
jgi:hypothetical protein